MVHIDTSDPIRNYADLFCHATQQYGAYRHIRPNTNRAELIYLQPNNMMHIDTSDPTLNQVDLVCHAT